MHDLTVLAGPGIFSLENSPAPIFNMQNISLNKAKCSACKLDLLFIKIILKDTRQVRGVLKKNLFWNKTKQKKYG